MADYISREAALNFELEIEAEPEEIEAISKGMALMSEYIKGLPAADVAPRKTGKWIVRENEVSWWMECSECGDRLPRNIWGTAWQSPYCPTCGARLENSLYRGAE